MKVLVVGGGGREHALAWKLSRERGVRAVISAPGNPGIASVARLAAVKSEAVRALAELASREGIDLTVVGPEAPLDAGIVDEFHARGLRIFGPSRAAAQLESSKVFAKQFMSRHGIPTARYRVCADASEADRIVRSGELGLPVVVKADGLAAGKGVVVAETAAEAHAAIHAAMVDRQFGAAGGRVVLEECMIGPEVSFFAICDGRRALPLRSAQDHKRIFDGDDGPNTGGMGAFAPSPLVDAAMQDRIMRLIVEPVVAGMRADGHEYRGFLYAGLMITCDGPKVVEFNVRFGDPEAQVVIPAVTGDLSPHLLAASQGALSGSVDFSGEKHVGVVIASRGYPGPVITGQVIHGLDEVSNNPDVVVFHSGTAQDGSGRTVTAGGRVLTIVGKGTTFAGAIDRAYAGVSTITFDGMQYRKDIGKKALTQ